MVITDRIFKNLELDLRCKKIKRIYEKRIYTDPIAA